MSNAVQGTGRNGYEFCATIGSDVAWNAMLGENVENE